MPREQNAFKVGVFMIVIGALFVGVVLWIPNRLFAGSVTTIRVRFPHTYPLPMLDEGSTVLVGGQKVGVVKEVKLEEDHSSRKSAGSQPSVPEVYVMVTAEISGATRLRRDAKVRAEGPPLGGIGNLLIELGTDRLFLDMTPDLVIDGEFPSGFGALLQSVGSLVAKELDGSDSHSLLGRVKGQLDPGDTASLVFKLHRSLEDINSMTGNVRLQFDPAQRDAILQKLVMVADNLNAATGALREQMDPQKPEVMLSRVNTAIDSLNAGLIAMRKILDENQAPIHETMGHVAHASDTLDRRILENIAAQTDIQNEAGLMAKISAAADQLNATMKNITAVTAATREITVLNRDNINEILRNFRQTSDQFKSSAKYILRRPWLLFNAPSASTTREQDILDSARTFSEAAARLDDACADLRALSDLRGGTIAGNDAELKRIQQQLQDTFTKFHEAEAALWKNLDIKK